VEGVAMTLATKRVNEDLFSGVITDVDPNIMNADDNRKTIDRIVIHHNAGTSDEGARRTWYVSTGVGTSANYQVTPTKIWGCVGEESVAYHAGKYSMNQRSIGIEHLNSTGAPSWLIAEETYKNSAKLIADICERYNIPIDRKHIIKHSEVYATACPGGIDIDKLIRMAKEIKSPTKAVKPTATLKITNVDFNKGEFKVVLSNINSPSGISKVEFPTWTSQNDQDDIKWYEGAKEGNNYVKYIKIADHKNERGVYIVHAYITTSNGERFGVGAYDMYLHSNVSGTLEITNPNYDAGTFDVVLKNPVSNNGIVSVQFPTWTDDKDQDDIKWYKGVKQADGSYKYTVKTSDHNKQTGKYHVHAYIELKNNQIVGVGGGTIDFVKPQVKPTTPKDEIIIAVKEDTSVKTVVLTEQQFNELKNKQ
jgi:hypothetical protein